MERENLWVVKCTDREDDDVPQLREEYMAGHLSHLEAIVDHIAMAGPLKDPSGSRIVGSLLAYRTDDLAVFKAHLEERGIAYSDWGETAVAGWQQIFFYDPDGNIIEVHEITC